MNPAVGIIILNHITWELTVNCIANLDRQDHDSFFIVVVDNNSPFECRQNLEHELTVPGRFRHEIHIIRSESNRGYAGGNNLGIHKAEELGAEFVLVINNDIIAEDVHLVSDLTFFMKTHSSAAMAGPRVLDTRRRQQESFNTRPSLFQYMGAYPRRWYRKPVRFLDKAGPRPVYSLVGACVMFRVSALREAAYMDEHTFLYGEELILAERFHRLDWDAFLLPAPAVTHLHNRTISRVYRGLRRLYMRYQAESYYFRTYRRIPLTGRLIFGAAFWLDALMLRPARWLARIPGALWRRRRNFELFTAKYPPARTFQQEDLADRPVPSDALVSIIIPTLSRGIQADHLFSLKSLLSEYLPAQTYTQYEVLLYTDGPNPAVIELVEQLDDARIRVFETDFSGNWGHPQTRMGINAAKGDFIVRMNDDNIPYPDYLRALLQGFEEGIDLTYVRVLFAGPALRTHQTSLSSSPSPEGEFTIPSDPQGIIRRRNIDCMNIMVRTAIARVHLKAWTDHFNADWRFIKSILRSGARTTFINQTQATKR